MSEAAAKPGTAGRRLMRRQQQAALGTTLSTDPGGRPYVSLVLTAFDTDAAPLLLLSDLAQHTRNIAADPHVALLFDGTSGHADPLSGPRLTVLGRAERSDDPRLLARFAARHPSSAAYAGFGDFRLYRVSIERGHLVAGFGRIDWIAGGELVSPGAEALAAATDEIVAHMNADHADAVGLYADRLLGLSGEGWRMTAIDPDGIELRRGQDAARLDFAEFGAAEPVLTPAAARTVLAALARRARTPPPGGTPQAAEIG